MANWTWSSTGTGSNTIDFRAWIDGIQLALTTIGLVLDDAGNVGSTPTANNTAMQYYEVYRFDDAAQATAPIFLKVMYGSGGYGGSYYYWRLHIQVGIANLGGGVITDPLGTQNYVAFTPVVALVSANYASSDGSGIALALGFSGSNTNVESIFVVDRHRNPATGAALTTGAFVQGAYSGGTRVLGNYSFGAGAGANLYSTVPCVTDGTLSSTTPRLNAGGKTQLYPWWSITPEARGISKMIATYNEADIGTLTPGGYSCTFLGGSHHYLTFGSRIQGAFSVFGEAGAAPAIWWSTP